MFYPTPCAPAQPYRFPHFILSTEAATALQWKHGKLIRSLDRIISMLPPDEARRCFQQGRNSIGKRIIILNLHAWPLLFLGDANNVVLRFALDMLNKTDPRYNSTKNRMSVDLTSNTPYSADPALCVTGPPQRPDTSDDEVQ